jgi:hypothetical protein
MTSPAPESSVLSVPGTELFITDSQASIPMSREQQSNRSTSPRSSLVSVKRSRTSFVWKHMPGPVNTIYIRGQQVYWRCQYCTREYRESGGTAYIALHLKIAHDIQDEVKQQRASSQQLSIASAFQHGEESQHKRRRLNSSINSINPASLEQLFVRWISSCSIPFRLLYPYRDGNGELAIKQAS